MKNLFVSLLFLLFIGCSLVTFAACKPLAPPDNQAGGDAAKPALEAIEPWPPLTYGDAHCPIATPPSAKRIVARDLESYEDA